MIDRKRIHRFSLRVAAAAGLATLAALVPLTGLGQERSTAPTPSSAARPFVLEIRLEDDPITPATARFIDRVIAEAETSGAECLIFVLDTPGGLLDSTRDIVKRILGARACIVVYVAPSGARAASAGVFITLSAHIAAMAPGTTIGAAHPVQVGGLPIGPAQPPAPGESPFPMPEIPTESGDEPSTRTQEDGPRFPASSVMEEKIVNDTVAWVRALAGLRGRNEEWAADAVTKSVSIVADEALEKGVVDLIAENLDDLLTQIDGREIELAGGTKTLRTAGAEVRLIEMWYGEKILSVISNPNIAFLLLMFGFYGILFELYSPGWGVAGTLGLVCLLLGFFGMSVLPINYLGLGLIAVALGLFVAEAFVTSFGVLALGGVTCLVLGGLMLVDSPKGFLRISLTVLLPVAAATGVIAVVLVTGVIRAMRGKVLTGTEGLSTDKAVADGDFEQDAEGYLGLVFVHGERWRARCAEPVAGGDKLLVLSREGLLLEVEAARAGADAEHGSPSKAQSIK